MELKAQPEHAGDEGLPQERREWAVQRVWWAFLALFLIAALLGAFGHGWLAKAKAVSPGGTVTIDYDRIIRLQDQAKVTLTVHRWTPDERGRVPVAVGTGYFDNFRVESIVPEPAEQQSGPGEMVLKFEPVREGVPLVVELRMKVERMGTISGRVRVPGRPGSGAELRGEELHFEQFALP